MEIRANWCKFCSFKCIASDCECICHSKFETLTKEQKEWVEENSEIKENGK